MMTKIHGSRRELATLFSIVLRHPCLSPSLQAGIYELFSEVHPMVDQYATPEGIELYLEAHAIRDGMRHSQEGIHE